MVEARVPVAGLIKQHAWSPPPKGSTHAHADVQQTRAHAPRQGAQRETQRRCHTDAHLHHGWLMDYSDVLVASDGSVAHSPEYSVTYREKGGTQISNLEELLVRARVCP